MTNTTTEDPAAIEQEIRQTQDDMSRTVDRIGDQLTMRNIFNALLDKADENNVDARMVVDGARRNPIALGLIAAGTIWLVSDKDSKFPSIRSGNSGGSGSDDFDDQDVHHRDYVTHMSAVELRDGEDPITYQRRRDIARANFLMCEPRPDEDEHSYRQRLDDLTEKFRERRRAWMDSAGQARAATGETARRAVSRTQEMYSSNPLAGGLIAAAVGAAFGSALPISRQEQEKLGSVGSKARDMASQQKEQLSSQVREKKDELLEKSEQKLQEQNAQGSASETGSQFGGTEPAVRQPQPSFGGPTS